MVAYDKKRMSMVHKLLNLKADICTTDAHGNTLLMLAAEFGDLEFADVLIESGIEINQQNNDGRAALWYTVVSHFPFISPLPFF